MMPALIGSAGCWIAAWFLPWPAQLAQVLVLVLVAGASRSQGSAWPRPDPAAGLRLSPAHQVLRLAGALAAALVLPVLGHLRALPPQALQPALAAGISLPVLMLPLHLLFLLREFGIWQFAALVALRLPGRSRPVGFPEQRTRELAASIMALFRLATCQGKPTIRPVRTAWRLQYSRFRAACLDTMLRYGQAGASWPLSPVRTIMPLLRLSPLAILPVWTMLRQLA